MAESALNLSLNEKLSAASAALDALEALLSMDSVHAAEIDSSMLNYATAVQSIDIEVLNETELEHLRSSFTSLALRNQQLIDKASALRDQFAGEFSSQRAKQKGISAYKQQSSK